MKHQVSNVKHEVSRGLLLALALCLIACARKDGLPGDTLSRLQAPPGWTRTEVRSYDRETVSDLVDGQVETFLVYGLEAVAVGRYQNAEGAILEASVWQFPPATDAFGLYAVSRPGQPVSLGNVGDEDPGRRLAIWQNCYVVQIRSRHVLPQAEMRAFGQALAAVLPPGGGPSWLACPRRCGRSGTSSTSTSSTRSTRPSSARQRSTAIAVSRGPTGCPASSARRCAPGPRKPSGWSRLPSPAMVGRCSLSSGLTSARVSASAAASASGNARWKVRRRYAW